MTGPDEKAPARYARSVVRDAWLIESEAGEARFIVEAGSSPLFGRDVGCDVVARSRLVSRRHAVFEHDGGQLTVRDAESAGGTFVDGDHIGSRTVALCPDSRVRCAVVTLSTVPLRGCWLRERVMSSAPADAEVLRWLADVLDDLAVLHGLGIVHADVDVNDVFLVGDRARLMIATPPFGNAPALRNPRYTAPEQAQGATVSQATDFYALGCVFFETMAGCYPFPDETVPTMLAAQLRGQRRPTPARWPAEISELFDALLQPNPSTRPRDVGQVRSLVQRATRVRSS